MAGVAEVVNGDRDFFAFGRGDSSEAFGELDVWRGPVGKGIFLKSPVERFDEFSDGDDWCVWRTAGVDVLGEEQQRLVRGGEVRGFFGEGYGAERLIGNSNDDGTFGGGFGESSVSEWSLFGRD